MSVNFITLAGFYPPARNAMRYADLLAQAFSAANNCCCTPSGLLSSTPTKPWTSRTSGRSWPGSAVTWARFFTAALRPVCSTEARCPCWYCPTASA